jgi:LysR family transcriptional regulator, regulator for genes of the gallate degradation pathway
MTTTDHNLRHLRLFVAVVETGSLTRASVICNVTQPAVTQALARLEALCGTALFERTRQGLFPNPIGQKFAGRIMRALDLLDTASETLAPRLKLTATTAKLKALVAVADAENFSIAARTLDIAQPTVHRAITQLEIEIGRPLFRRSPHGSVPTRAGRVLANAAQLAFSELKQAEMEIAEAIGRGTLRITVGGMPLSRSYLLPPAIAEFQRQRPEVLVQVLEGPYDTLLAGLRRGEIDVLVGALRDPLPVSDVEQECLFADELVVVAGTKHPLTAMRSSTLAAARNYPWVVSPPGTPTRRHFEDHLASGGVPFPSRIVETSSMILMRELLNRDHYLGCISRLQVASEIRHGLLVELPFRLKSSRRKIGLTTRLNWKPTATQSEFLDLLRTSGDL